MHKIITSVFDKNRKCYCKCETKNIERWHTYGWYYQRNTIKHCFFFKSAKWGNSRGRRGRNKWCVCVWWVGVVLINWENCNCPPLQLGPREYFCSFCLLANYVFLMICFPLLLFLITFLTWFIFSFSWLLPYLVSNRANTTNIKVLTESRIVLWYCANEFLFVSNVVFLLSTSNSSLYFSG